MPNPQSFNDYVGTHCTEKQRAKVMDLLDGVKGHDIIALALGLVQPPEPDDDWTTKGVADGSLVGATEAAKLLGVKARTLKLNTTGKYPAHVALDKNLQNRRLWEVKVCREWRQAKKDNNLDIPVPVP